jgi:citronellol/citronellal dehydrogenase
MADMLGRTCIITGASRGIGREIALRFARDGANVVIASKTAEPHPKLPGTIHTVAAEVEEAGGKALALQVDVRFEEAVQEMVDRTVETFGGIDVLVNNAGAIQLTNTADTPMKRFDLMHAINVRATYMCTKLCLPHLAKSDRAHVLSLSPPPNIEARWLSGHVAYTLSKFGMSMCTIGWGEELKELGISATSLWPRTTIATAAVDMLLGDEGMKASRSPAIMADAAYEIVTTEGLALTGRCLLDEEILRERGYTDFEKYNMTPGVEPMPDLYV